MRFRLVVCCPQCPLDVRLVSVVKLSASAFHKALSGMKSVKNVVSDLAAAVVIDPAKQSVLTHAIPPENKKPRPEHAELTEASRQTRDGSGEPPRKDISSIQAKEETLARWRVGFRSMSLERHRPFCKLCILLCTASSAHFACPEAGAS